MFAIGTGEGPRRSARNPRKGRGASGSRSGLERLKGALRARTADEEAELFGQIAEQVVEQRLAWDLSQAELAELCGTTQSAIARIERGTRPPRIDTLARIANALDCELVVEIRPRTERGSEGEESLAPEGRRRRR
jgi:ribosome-binding protein aMBF1 (putative translation factor)